MLLSGREFRSARLSIINVSPRAFFWLPDGLSLFSVSFSGILENNDKETCLSQDCMKSPCCVCVRVFPGNTNNFATVLLVCILLRIFCFSEKRNAV